MVFVCPVWTSFAFQEYIPAYLLRGLIPAALLASHDFWQDTGESCRCAEHRGAA